MQKEKRKNLIAVVLCQEMNRENGGVLIGTTASRSPRKPDSRPTFRFHSPRSASLSSCRTYVVMRGSERQECFRNTLCIVPFSPSVDVAGFVQSSLGYIFPFQ